MQIYHPDPQVEAVRWSITEGALIQDAVRGRHVWRDLSKPLHMDLATNVCLPIPVHELITWDQLLGEAGPLELMMARGVVPLDWAGTAKVLSDMFSSAQAAKDWFQSNPEEMARRIKCLSSSETPIESSLLAFSTNSQIYFHRRQGERQGSKVRVRGTADEARELAERYLGPLAKFEPADKPKRGRGRPRKVALHRPDLAPYPRLVVLPRRPLPALKRWEASLAPVTADDLTIDADGLRHLPPRRFPLRLVINNAIEPDHRVDPGIMFRLAVGSDIRAAPEFSFPSRRLVPRSKPVMWQATATASVFDDVDDNWDRAEHIRAAVWSFLFETPASARMAS